MHAKVEVSAPTVCKPKARLREDLKTWIDLHLSERVSGVLLILGRAFEFDRKPEKMRPARWLSCAVLNMCSVDCRTILCANFHYIVFWHRDL